MNLTYILLKKSFRDGEIIFILFMSIICFGLLYKGLLTLFPLFIFFFRQKYYYLIWDDNNNKKYYQQFDSSELKKIVISKEVAFFFEFNFVYVVVFYVLFFLKFQSNPFLQYNLILNFFIISNFIFSNITFNFFNNEKIKNGNLKWFILILFYNAFLILVAYTFLFMENDLFLFVLVLINLQIMKYSIKFIKINY